MIKDIAIVSIDMSTCDFDSDHRIFARPIEVVGDTNTLLCEFESANYDYENTKMVKKKEEQIEDLKIICWLPLEHLGVASIDFDLIPVEEFVEGIKIEAFTDYDGIELVCKKIGKISEKCKTGKNSYKEIFKSYDKENCDTLNYIYEELNKFCNL